MNLFQEVMWRGATPVYSKTMIGVVGIESLLFGYNPGIQPTPTAVAHQQTG